METHKHFEHEASFFKHKSIFFKLVVAIFVGIFMMICASILVALLTNQCYGISAAEILGDPISFFKNQQGNINCIRFAQMSNTFIAFGLSAFLMSFWLTGSIFGFFKAKSVRQPASFLVVPFILISAIPIIAALSFLLKQLPFPEQFLEMEENGMAFMEGLISNTSKPIFLLNFLMIAIMPAIFEELYFRGILQRLFIQLLGKKRLLENDVIVHQENEKGVYIAIAITGLLFGLIHGQITNFLPIAILGSVLGLIYYWSKNIWLPIFGHLCFNGFQVVGHYVNTINGNVSESNSLEMLPLPITLGAFLLFITLLYVFFRFNQQNIDEQ